MKEILEKCKTLQEYMIYVTKVRKYAAAMDIQVAVECAVNECIKQGVLKDFLLRYKAEAIQMSIFEYDEEREMQLIKESMRQVYSKEGREEGKKEGRKQGLEEGRKEGRKEGEELFAALTEKLLKDSRNEDLLRAISDMKFREKLYKEYGIKGE